MYIIDNQIVSSIEIDKSKFIATLIPFDKLNQLNKHLMEIKALYPNAKHYLYAYKMGDIFKGDNDQEPVNVTKGIYTLITRNNLDYLLIIIVRYFGGIKLGSSRLLRSYLKVVNNAIKNSKRHELKKIYRCHAITDYATFNKIQNAGYKVDNVIYDDKIKLDILGDSIALENLKKINVQIIDIKEEIGTI